MAQAPVPPDDRLSSQLKAVAERCKTESVSVEVLLNTLRGSPYLLLTALLSLPFLTPVPMMGLSMPIGFLIGLFGVYLIFGQKPIVPQNLMEVKIPQKFFPAVLKGTSNLLRGIEVFIKPRWRFFTNTMILWNIYGVLILLSSMLLLLPLPIPFTNFFPALTLLLLSLGLIERDGICILLGVITFFMTLGFFALIFFGGRELLQHLHLIA